jgi:hypothetical protein
VGWLTERGPPCELALAPFGPTLSPPFLERLYFGLAGVSAAHLVADVNRNGMPMQCRVSVRWRGMLYPGWGRCDAPRVPFALHADRGVCARRELFLRLTLSLIVSLSGGARAPLPDGRLGR